MKNELSDVVPGNPDTEAAAFSNLQDNVRLANAVATDESAQVAQLLTNDRLDDDPQLAGAGRELANAAEFLHFFQDSFQEFKQEAAYRQLQAGQSIRWQPVVRDRYGQVVGGFPTVRLRANPANRLALPLIQLSMPQHNWVAQLAPPPAREQVSDLPTHQLQRNSREYAQAVLTDQLGPDGQRKLVAALLTPIATYSPTSPKAFAQAIIEWQQLHPALPVGLLASLFPLERLTSLPHRPPLRPQHINEIAFSTQTRHYQLTTQQETALLLGHILLAPGVALAYDLPENRLECSRSMLVVRPNRRIDQKLVTQAFVDAAGKAGLAPARLDRVRFAREYGHLFTPTSAYDPADPINFYGRLSHLTEATLRAGGLAESAITTTTTQFIDEQWQRGQLVRVPDLLPIRQVLSGQRSSSAQRLVDRLTSQQATTVLNEATLLHHPHELAHYKGVTLTTLQRVDLLAGKSIVLDGLRDPGRGSLYQASVTLDALTTKRAVGQSEHLHTDSKSEAKAHPALTGGASTTTDSPSTKEVNRLAHQAQKPPVVPPPRLRL